MRSSCTISIEDPEGIEYEVDLSCELDPPEDDVGYGGGLASWKIDAVEPVWPHSTELLDSLVAAKESSILEAAFENLDDGGPDYD